MHCLLCKNKETFMEGLWSNSRCYLQHFPCFLPFPSSGCRNSFCFSFLRYFLDRYFRCLLAPACHSMTLSPLLCIGLSASSLMSGIVTGFSSFIFLTETSMWVPSHAKIFGLYSHHGSTSFRKSILKAAIHEKYQEINVFPDMKRPE